MHFEYFSQGALKWMEMNNRISSPIIKHKLTMLPFMYYINTSGTLLAQELTTWD